MQSSLPVVRVVSGRFFVVRLLLRRRSRIALVGAAVACIEAQASLGWYVIKVVCCFSRNVHRSIVSMRQGPFSEGRPGIRASFVDGYRCCGHRAVFFLWWRKIVSEILMATNHAIFRGSRAGPPRGLVVTFECYY